MQYFIVDAFTDQPLRGNPAAVVLVDKVLTDEQMQAIAAEFNLSETAFLINKEVESKTNNHWDLRWFTPTTEIELCGHATLASAYALWFKTEQNKMPLTFHTQSGELTVSLRGETLLLNFPTLPTKPATLNDEQLAALQLKPVNVFTTEQDLFIEVESEQIVRNYQPNFATIVTLQQRSLTITAQAEGEVDFVSRMFGPKIGIPEDPVTGVVHCSLTPYWAEKLDKSRLKAYQASARGGFLTLELKGDRVSLGGKAYCTMQGELLI